MSKTNKNFAEDAEDHEIFDINDFTTASDWERSFIIKKFLHYIFYLVFQN
jgi:hypothetical protein